MKELWKKYLDPVVNFWKKLTKKTKKIILAAFAGIVVLAVTLSLVLNRTQYVELYTGLDSDEAQQISSLLKNMNEEYKLENSTLYVKSGDENTVRMELSDDGYPKSVPNYDYFTNNVNAMTTDEEMNIIKQYQMETRLGAVIETLDPVQTAYVSINLSDSSDYAWNEDNSQNSASITVKLYNNRSLSSKQVSGIQTLVSTSVPKLDAKNVSVIDGSTGEALTSSSGSDSSDDGDGSLQITLSEFKLKIENEYENNIESKVKSLLASTYGADNISVSVKSQMSLDKRIQDIITYTPSTSDGKGVVSNYTETHEQTVVGTSSGSVPGTTTNSDTTTNYSGVTLNGNTITTKDSETYNYLVSQVEEQVQSDAANLNDLTVSVIINTQAITPDQQTQITSLIANAAGVDPSKVALMTQTSQNTGTASQTAVPANASVLPELFKNPLYLAIGAGVLIVLLTAVLLIAAARRRKRDQELAESLNAAAAEEMNQKAKPEPPVPTESIEELRQASGGVEQRVKKDLQDFSSNNPEIVAQLIRSWMKGEDDHE